MTRKRSPTTQLLKTFWENHDPTQGMRQGNDIGTQYRSGIYTFTPAQQKAAEASKAMYEQELKKKRYGAITTEIVDAPEFYFAEDYHQQYLAKNPFGYCGLGGTGVVLPDRDRRKADARRDGLIACAAMTRGQQIHATVARLSGAAGRQHPRQGTRSSEIG